MERDILDDAVALVEDPEHRDALRHRRHATLSGRSRRRLSGARPGRILLLGPLAARGKCEGREQGCSGRLHAYSGIQGS
jgi:hypothetical protein